MNGRPPNLKLCCRYVVRGFISMSSSSHGCIIFIDMRSFTTRRSIYWIKTNTKWKLKLQSRRIKPLLYLSNATYVRTIMFKPRINFVLPRNSRVCVVLKIYEINMLQLLWQRLNFQWTVGFDMVLSLQFKVNKRRWPSS